MSRLELERAKDNRRKRIDQLKKDRMRFFLMQGLITFVITFIAIRILKRVYGSGVSSEVAILTTAIIVAITSIIIILENRAAIEMIEKVDEEIKYHTDMLWRGERD